MVCIYKCTGFFLPPRHATHDLASSVHLAVLSVGGVSEKLGGVTESVSTAS